MTDRKPHQPRKLTPEQLAEIYALPDDALVTAAEAAAVLRVKHGTLAWHRTYRSGPPFTRIGPKSVRYRMGDLRAYASGRRSTEALNSASAMLAARGIAPAPKVGGAQ